MASNLEMKARIKAMAIESTELRKSELAALIKARTLSENAAREEDDKKSELDLEAADFHYLRKWNLHHKRTAILRKKARSHYLAYAFLKGRAYSDLEEKCHETPDWDKVERLVMEYSTPHLTRDDEESYGDNIIKVKQKFEEWIQLAKAVPPVEKIAVAA